MNNDRYKLKNVDVLLDLNDLLNVFDNRSKVDELCFGS